MKDNVNFVDAIPEVATASDKEVARMVEAAQAMSVYCAEDLARFKPGDHLLLQGYPFDGMPAEILEIKPKRGEVVVQLNIESIVRKVTVSFENVYYTIYKNYNENSREESSDEFNHRFGPSTMDNITFRKLHNGDWYNE